MRVRRSVAMSDETADRLRQHLDRADGQEDICLGLYMPSTGKTSKSALIVEVVPPLPGERHVHGNASIESSYVLRAAALAAEHGAGVAMAHSHPGGSNWQGMSGPDRDAESSLANLVREITGLPLVGMTYGARNRSWSARSWDCGVGRDVEAKECDSVRVVGPELGVTWNDRLVSVPPTGET